MAKNTALLADELESIINALPSAVLIVDESGCVRFFNAAAEILFETSAGVSIGQPITDLIPSDSPICGLVRQAGEKVIGMADHAAVLDTPRTGRRDVTAHAAPLMDHPGWVMLSLQENSIALKIGEQMSHRHAARSVTGMAAVLAHEVKNPLSGIRGAAQLLEQGVADEDRPLTQLIQDEVARIVALLDRMDVFADRPMRDVGPVNIHGVLEHVRRVAESGFAHTVAFQESYDPSLPPVLGNRDQLIQIFLNLVKNAAEAVNEEPHGQVHLSTAYRQGVRVAVPGSDERLNLPLMVSIQDNGPGIPEDLRPHLFDPFVSTKPKGSGLGLAVVAKLVSDHGGVIEVDSQPGRTVFRVMLPMSREDVRPQDRFPFDGDDE